MRTLTRNLFFVSFLLLIAPVFMCYKSVNKNKSDFAVINQDSTIIGTWISEEDNNWKLEFRNDGTCLSVYIGSSTDTCNYTISNTSPQCGITVPVDQYSNYLQLTNVSDTTDRICYLLNGFTSTHLSISSLEPNGKPTVFFKEGTPQDEEWNVETQGMVFDVAGVGIRAIWSNSFNEDGTPYKEAHGVLVWDQNGNSKFIALPMGSATPTHPHGFDNLNFFVDNGNAYWEYEGNIYQVRALFHTHPDPAYEWGGEPYDNYFDQPDDWTPLFNLYNAGAENVRGVVIADEQISSFGVTEGIKDKFNHMARQEYFDGNCLAEL